jgi:hypothetical protein
VIAAWLAALPAGLVFVLVTVVAAGPAIAADGGGAPICFDGVCTIGVSAPGGPGSGGGGGSGGGPIAVSDPSVCTNTNPLSGCDPCPLDGTAPADPAACAAFEQNLFCSEQNPAGTGASAATWATYLQLIGCAANAYTPPDPAVLAVQAAAEFDLSVPTIDRSPDADLRYAGYAYTYANLATWFWTSPVSWAAQSKTVTVHSAVAGDVWATATAAPAVLVFDPGDGGADVSCPGPGQAWQPADGNEAAPSGCSYIYRAATSGPVTATVSIDWQVTWTGSYGMGGVLPVQITAAAQQLQVLQVDSVNR